MIHPYSWLRDDQTLDTYIGEDEEERIIRTKKNKGKKKELCYISKLLIIAASALLLSVEANNSDNLSLRSSTSLCKLLM